MITKQETDNWTEYFKEVLHAEDRGEALEESFKEEELKEEIAREESDWALPN